ncbi:MAG TPA: c-type cytochrome, partial [Candidatus Limnocylindrales bacterium]|nr:c-type cytochrome [Candidatus Limnocylindrales bacterium]
MGQRAGRMHKLAAACLLATLTLLATTSAAFAQDQARRLVALLDYLGGDYQNAVQNGKIVNKDEYAEMQEFSKRITELMGQLKAIEKADKAQIEPMLKSLVGEVEKKGDEKTVAKLANDAKERLIATYKIVPHPRQLPALADGRTIFIENCVQCHGPGGKGDGPGRESMNPKTPLPANLTDPEFMAGLSPFKAYNTVSFGIENTAMSSFAALSDEQRWQVAFYALALRFPAETSAAGEAWLKGKSLPPDLVNVATLATTSDGDLSAKIKKLFPDGPNGAILAYLRRGLLDKKSADPLLIARTLIGEAATLYAGGENEKAYQKAIEAYLDGFEMAEPALFAKDGSLGRSLENQFTQFRNSIRQRVPVEEIQKQRREIDLKLDQAGLTLASGDENLSGFYAFLNSALIILREGLEATLILAAIIAMLKVMGAATAIRYIHLGWVLALIAGAVTWIAAQTVLTFSGQHRESMEGFISIFA